MFPYFYFYSFPTLLVSEQIERVIKPHLGARDAGASCVPRSPKNHSIFYVFLETYSFTHLLLSNYTHYIKMLE